VTEEEWLNGCDYRRMYRLAKPSASVRRVRLFMAACCQLDVITYTRLQCSTAIQIAERCADDIESERLLCDLWNRYVTLSPNREGFETEIGKLVDWISRVVRRLPTPPDLDEDETYSDVTAAVTHAAYLSLREEPKGVFVGGSGDAAEYCARAMERAELLRLARRAGSTESVETRARRPIANILRDIFGNPFRPVAFDPRWRTSDVVGLARAIYDDKAFERMPIMADALMDAGCEDEQVISHCRSDGPHVRGCWVVDLILGKE
jgi:hypothetical protein